MWLGTTDGLCRYDGMRFKIYRRTAEDTSLISHNNILSLFTDTKGRVWAGTSNGLNRYNEKTDAFEYAGGRQVWAIYEDSKGRLWMGGSDGLTLMNHQKNIHFKIQSTVRSVFEDSQGRIWIGSDKGVSILEDRNNKTVLTTLSTLLVHALPAELRNITSIAADANHKIWIGTQNNGAYCFDPHSGSLIHYQSNKANSQGLINNNIRRIFLDKKINIAQSG